MMKGERGDGTHAKGPKVTTADVEGIELSDISHVYKSEKGDSTFGVHNPLRQEQEW